MCGIANHANYLLKKDTKVETNKRNSGRYSAIHFHGFCVSINVTRGENLQYVKVGQEYDQLARIV